MPEPTNPVLIQHLTPRNFLSFGPDNPGIQLQALNILIGPNGSGKSNLIEAIDLMRATPKDVRDVTRKGGGVSEWIWKGQPKEPASVELVVTDAKDLDFLVHSFAFRSTGHSFALEDESIKTGTRLGPDEPFPYSSYQSSIQWVRLGGEAEDGLKPGTIKLDRSVLAQLRDPQRYPVFDWLTQNYERIRIYREWSFGRNTIFREPKKPTCAMTPSKRTSPTSGSSSIA